MKQPPPYWSKAKSYLSKKDKVLKSLIKKYNSGYLISRNDVFFSLCKSIIGQQISVAAANSVFNKFNLACKNRITPKQVNLLKPSKLKKCGLSRQKVRGIKDLAKKYLDKSFNPNLVKNNVEKIIKSIFSEAFDIRINSSFPSLSFHDAINLYGTDKPDLRIKETINDATNVFSNSNVSFIKDSIDSSGVFKYLFTPKFLTRKEIDNFDALAKELGSNGLGWIKFENQNFSGPLTKHMSDDELSFVSSLGEGTFLFQVGNLLDISKTMDMLRTKLYERSEKEEHVFLWVEDFPYFEIENNVLQPSHHPFTSPQNVDDFENNPIEAIALHYDLVLNGVELGSGSQRINNPDLQTLVLKKWGLSDSEIQNRFGWFIEALSYGTPQHAGFAIGIDRLVAEVMKQHSIRDVIPFPKTQSGMDPLTDAPTTLDADLLEEYNLKVIDDNE